MKPFFRKALGLALVAACSEDTCNKDTYSARCENNGKTIRYCNDDGEVDAGESAAETE